MYVQVTLLRDLTRPVLVHLAAQAVLGLIVDLAEFAEWPKNKELDQRLNHNDGVRLHDERRHVNEPCRVEVVELAGAESQGLSNGPIEARRSNHE